MRKSLLMGLAALAFGVLPSCSNILEESGINPAVKGETGELRIAWFSLYCGVNTGFFQDVAAGGKNSEG